MSARITEAMVEAALSVWFEANDPWYAGIAFDVAEDCRKQMKAAIAASISTEPGEAEGMVLVPREPTREMIRAGSYEVSGLTHTGANCVYRAMLAAAPLPEESHHGR